MAENPVSVLYLLPDGTIGMPRNCCLLLVMNEGISEIRADYFRMNRGTGAGFILLQNQDRNGTFAAKCNGSPLRAIEKNPDAKAGIIGGKIETPEDVFALVQS